jgi:hypothetical protein
MLVDIFGPVKQDAVSPSAVGASTYWNDDHFCASSNQFTEGFGKCLLIS